MTADGTNSTYAMRIEGGRRRPRQADLRRRRAVQGVLNVSASSGRLRVAPCIEDVGER